MHTNLKACQTGQYHAQVERKALKSELPRCNLNISDFFRDGFDDQIIEVSEQKSKKIRCFDNFVHILVIFSQ